MRALGERNSKQTVSIDNQLSPSTSTIHDIVWIPFPTSIGTDDKTFSLHQHHPSWNGVRHIESLLCIEREQKKLQNAGYCDVDNFKEWTSVYYSTIVKKTDTIVGIPLDRLESCVSQTTMHSSCSPQFLGKYCQRGKPYLTQMVPCPMMLRLDGKAEHVKNLLLDSWMAPIQYYSIRHRRRSTSRSDIQRKRRTVLQCYWDSKPLIMAHALHLGQCYVSGVSQGEWLCIGCRSPGLLTCVFKVLGRDAALFHVHIYFATVTALEGDGDAWVQRRSANSRIGWCIYSNCERYWRSNQGTPFGLTWKCGCQSYSWCEPYSLGPWEQ